MAGAWNLPLQPYVPATSTSEHSRLPSTNTVELEFEREAMPHLDALYRAALRMVGSATDAQDIVQDVFLQAWRLFERYERGTNCRAWLFAILFNTVQHYRRRKYGQRVQPFDDEAALERLQSPGNVPEVITDTDILDALARLPDSYRDTVILADVQEFSYKETAEILGVPIGTVMSRLSRGRQLLRAALAESAREYGIRTSSDRGPT